MFAFFCWFDPSANVSHFSMWNFVWRLTFFGCRKTFKTNRERLKHFRNILFTFFFSSWIFITCFSLKYCQVLYFMCLYLRCNHIISSPLPRSGGREKNVTNKWEKNDNKATAFATVHCGDRTHIFTMKNPFHLFRSTRFVSIFNLNPNKCCARIQSHTHVEHSKCVTYWCRKTKIVFYLLSQ